MVKLEKLKLNYITVGCIVLICFVLFGFGGYYLGKQSSGSNQRIDENWLTPTPTIEKPQTSSVRCDQANEGIPGSLRFTQKCPNGCVQYGPPLGCVTREYAENCRSGGCPKCLSSSTNILTDRGLVQVKELQPWMKVLSVNKKGQKELQPLMKISSVNVGQNHHMYHLKLSDGRNLFASPGHPTADGRVIGDLIAGDVYDGSIVRSNNLIPYTDTKTYDLLPAGDTGYYFANGILMGSTLK